MSVTNSRTMNWMFTWNNPDYDSEPPNVWLDVKYAVWQHEVGATGTPHFQGYVMFTRLYSLKQLVERYPGLHWEPRRGTHEQAKTYCTKEDTRTHGPWEHGTEPAQGKRTDLESVAAYVRDHTMEQTADEFPAVFVRHERGIRAYKNIVTKHRDFHTQLIIYWGPPRTGKSTRVKELWPDAFWLKRGRSGEPWWDGYDGQATVVMDEFYGWISVDMMTRLIDQFPMTVEGKGTSMKFVSERIVLLSNQSPDTWWSCELHGMRRRLDEAVTFHVTQPIWLPQTQDAAMPHYGAQR
nr:MAG: replication associated protein [Arizlama virus]